MLRVIMLGVFALLLLTACAQEVAPAANQQPAAAAEGVPEVTVYKSPT